MDPFASATTLLAALRAGETTAPELLELYLELVREDPPNRQAYYRRISNIYTHQGNAYEANRFAAFAQNVTGEEKT